MTSVGLPSAHNGGGLIILAPAARVKYADPFERVGAVVLRAELLGSDDTLYIRAKTVRLPPREVMYSPEELARKYLEQFARLPRKPLRAVVRIDSSGGAVATAIGAAYSLHDLECPVTLLIDGECASSAMYLLAYSKAQHVYITAGGRLMLHNPAALSYTAQDEEKTAAHQEQLISDQARALAKLTGQSESQIRAWKDAETWFSAEQAVEYGFCEKIVDVSFE